MYQIAVCHGSGQVATGILIDVVLHLQIIAGRRQCSVQIKTGHSYSTRGQKRIYNQDFVITQNFMPTFLSEDCLCRHETLSNDKNLGCKFFLISCSCSTMTGTSLYSTAIPPYSTAIPLYSTAIPLYSTAIPLYSTAIPLYSTAIPLQSTSIPLNSTAIPL